MELCGIAPSAVKCPNGRFTDEAADFFGCMLFDRNTQQLPVYIRVRVILMEQGDKSVKRRGVVSSSSFSGIRKHTRTLL